MTNKSTRENFKEHEVARPDFSQEFIPTDLTYEERILWVDSMMSKHPGFFTVEELNRKLDLVQESIYDDESSEPNSAEQRTLEDDFDEFRQPDFDCFPLPVRLRLSDNAEENSQLRVLLITRDDGLTYAMVAPDAAFTRFANGDIQIKDAEYIVDSYDHGEWPSDFLFTNMAWQRQAAFKKLKVSAGFTSKISYSNFIKICIRKEIKLRIASSDLIYFNPKLNASRQSRSSEQAQARDLNYGLGTRLPKKVDDLTVGIGEQFDSYEKEIIPYGLSEEAMSSWLEQMLSKHPRSLLAEWYRVYDLFNWIYESEQVPVGVDNKGVREWTGKMTSRHEGSHRSIWKAIIEKAQYDADPSPLIPTGLNGLERDLWVESMMFKHPTFFSEDELYAKLDSAQKSLDKARAEDGYVLAAARSTDTFPSKEYLGIKSEREKDLRISLAQLKIDSERNTARFRAKRLAHYFTAIVETSDTEIECPTVFNDIYDDLSVDLPCVPAEKRSTWAQNMQWKRPGTTSKMWYQICSHFSPHESDPAPKRKFTSSRAPLFLNSESQYDNLILEVVKPFNYAVPVEKEARERENNIDLMKRLSVGITKKMVAAPPAGCLDQLYVDFPNFEPAISLIRDQLMLFARSKKLVPFHCEPILLLGAPGIGKTEFLQALASVLKIPQITVDLASVTSSFLLSGISSSYSGSKPGIILSTLTDEAEDSVANFLFIGDELCKLAGAGGSSGHNNGSAALFSLLESSSSCKFKDEFTDGKVSIDASYVNFAFSANSVDTLSEPLLSRLNVVTIEVPDYDQRIQITKSIYRRILKRNKRTWSPSFPAVLSESVVETLSKRFESPREIKRALMKALAAAATDGAKEVECDHIAVTTAGGRRRIGF